MTTAKSETARGMPVFRMFSSSVLAGVCIAAQTTAASSQEAAPAERARPMTAVEIHELYRDKSWQWENGAGQMKDEGRQFSAWSEGEKGKSWAEGRWVITNTGRMCLEATWHTDKGAFPAKTCFEHRIGKGTIYQRREPDGAWYVFRHETARNDDEARRLIPEDLVSKRRDDVKAALALVPRAEQ